MADSAGPRGIDLTRGWRFHLVEHVTPEAMVSYPRRDHDDSGWRVVDVPHDWSIELPPVAAAGTTAGTGFLPGGQAWYRRTLPVPPPASGRRVLVEFDRVYMDASVYLNGALVGRHAYGYTGFRVDLTGRLRGDPRNPDVLAVLVNHRVPSGRWYSGSGILGGVRLLVTGQVYLRRWGTQITTPDLEHHGASGVATVLVRNRVGNGGGTPVRVRVDVTVLDAAGCPVGSASTSVRVPPGGRGVTTGVRVADPTLWSTEDPYLYSLRVELRTGGRVVDHDLISFGMRYLRFDPDAGFFLNGRALRLYGVNLHHDQGALGAAVHPDAVRRQVALMRDMGANAIRTAHNPPTREVLDACQSAGLLVVVEAFDCWARGKNPYDYGRFFPTDGVADITEMVHAARNCPAVVMWSIGNEIPDAVSKPGLRMARRLVEAVRAADGTRPVVLCSDQYREVPAPGSPKALMLDLIDGLGLNYNTGASMDALHAAYPRLSLFESESSAQCSTRGVYERPDQLNVAENHTPGRRALSSYDNSLLPWTFGGEYALKQHRDRPFLAGQFLWTGIDYLGEPTPYHVFPVKAAFFGAVDTAGFPKDQYHLVRSQWSATPMVHLVPMDWTRHAIGERVEVRVYTNVEAVELYLNGESLGIRGLDRKTTLDGRDYLETTQTLPPGEYRSPNGGSGRLYLTWWVPFRPGTLVAVARRAGAELARDEVRTAGPAHALRLTPDRDRIPADGAALAFVTAEVVDRHGTLVPGADNAIDFQVTGGTLVALDNGRQESAEPYQFTCARTAFNGQALAIVRAGTEPAPLVVTARSAGLLPASATVHPSGPDPGGDGRPAPAPVECVRAPVRPAIDPVGPSGGPVPAADASYSGSPDTVPAAMLDASPGTWWSNDCRVPATQVLPEFDSARPSDWVSLAWPGPRRIAALSVTFVADGRHALPAGVEVGYDTGGGAGATVPVPGSRLCWTGTTATITFPPVRTARIRLDLTSAHPGRANGHLGIARLVPVEDDPRRTAGIR